MAGRLTGWRVIPTPGSASSVVRPAPFYVNAKAIAAAGAAEADTPPTGAAVVLFSANGDFYALPNGTATVPGDTSDGSASELNPASWALDDVTSISVISPAGGATQVTLTYYALKA